MPLMTCSLLFYITFTTYYGLFNIRIASYFSLDSTGQTDSFSLLYSVNRLNALAVPLCLNFLKLTNIKDTQFHKTLRPMDGIPIIGDTFQTIFPCFLVILCVVNYFDVWSKGVTAMGLEDLAFSNQFDPSRVENGQRIIKSEKSKAKQRGKEGDTEAGSGVGMTLLSGSKNDKTSSGSSGDENSSFIR